MSDYVDELMVMLLAEFLSLDVGRLVLRLDAVIEDSVVFILVFDEEESQHDVLYPGGVGTIAGHMKRRRVVDVEMNMVETMTQS